MTNLKKPSILDLKKLKNVLQLRILNKISLFCINFYRVYLSNYSKGCCRFHPTCSAYAKEAYTQLNFLSASKVVTLRLLRCRPFGPQGFDPLLQNKETS